MPAATVRFTVSPLPGHCACVPPRRCTSTASVGPSPRWSRASACLLGIWLRLLPGPLPPDVWQDDGYRYTLLATLVGLVSAFSNALLLWRAAGGPAPLRDPQELRRVHELGLRAGRGQPPHDEPP